MTTPRAPNSSLARQCLIAQGFEVRDEPTVEIERFLQVLWPRLLHEEVDELTAAVAAGDLVEVADGLADILYVAYQAAHSFGIPIDEVFAEVHRSNLTKVPARDRGIERRPGGKVLKPEGFSPPDLGPLLRPGTRPPAGHMPRADLEVCRSSHRRLLAGLAPLSDADLRGPSLLPRYSRGHVVTHLANKVKAHAVLFGGPAAGEVRHLHPVGYDADAAAAAGAVRSASELRSDLQESFEVLEAAWDSLEDAHWVAQGVMMAGSRTMSEIIGHHLRNVEVHHVDLDIGYSAADWPPTFIEAELARRLRTLPDRADRAALLLWLLDRAPARELEPW
jgi:maleylpyruvate isomerase